MSSRKSCSLLVLSLLSCASGWSQSLSLGLLGGGTATTDLDGTGATSVSKRYVVGPSFEIGLTHNFAFEFDALYRRQGFQTAWGNFAYYYFADERSNSWEFPLLFKYYLSVPAVRPFLTGGWAPRIMNGSISSNNVSYYPQPGPMTHSVSSTSWPSTSGIVVGGGVQARLGPLRISPALRYTRWNHSAITGVYGDGPSYQSTPDQFDILIGLAWNLR